MATFVDPWGVKMEGGTLDTSALIGRLAHHRDGEAGPIVGVDEYWPKKYMLTIEVRVGYRLIACLEQFTIPDQDGSEQEKGSEKDEREISD